jgi:LysM repeat protein
MTWATKLARPATTIAVVLLVLSIPLFQTYAQSGGSHTVQGGENLFRIALRYNTTVEALAAANGITDPSRIYAGQVLIIPGIDTPAVSPIQVDAAAVPVSSAAPVVQTQAAVYHTVQRGETLASIGRAYGIAWSDISAANGIADPNQIFAGQQLLIPGTTAPGTAAVAPPLSPAPVAVESAPAAAVSTGTQRTHIVQVGERLATIASQYGISWPTIASANNLADPNRIYVGQSLIIPAADIGQGTYLQPETWTPAAAPPTTSTGKQVVVDLSDQMTYAYENGQLLRSTAVSTGLYGTPTVQGDFHVYLKYDSQLMSGPGYYLPGVPYVMYFYKGYSLHGTYWHSNFGQPMSHGCVNMPTPEAQWFYNWAEIGTPVHVQW